jgi:tellurium resistance protein TerD
VVVDLPKGANVALPPQVHRVAVGLGWHLDAAGGAALEVDAQVVLLGEDGRVADDRALLFFSQLSATSTASPAASGAGSPGAEEDVEQVVVDLDAVPPAVVRIVVSAAIYGAAARRQSFRQVHRAWVRVADADTGTELARHALGEAAGVETAMVFGELYRHRAGWKFRAVGQGYAGGLAAVARDFGVSV